MKKFFKYVKYVSRKISANRMGAYSAQAAFFMFFSLIPLAMLLFSLMAHFGNASQEIMENAEEVVPGFFSRFVDTYLKDVIDLDNVSLQIISAIVLLWSASKGVYAIIGGLNSVYEIKESRKFFVVRLVAILYTAAFIVIVLAALLLMVFGKAIAGYIYELFDDLKGLVYFISSLRFIIGFVFLVMFFMIIYKALPGTKMRFVEQIPGAVLCSAGWVVFSILFSFYIDNFSHYANIYGSLTAIIVLMLWMYVCMYILFFGAQINRILMAKAPKNDLEETQK